MPKLWLVAENEYLNAVRKRSFVLATLGVPLFILGVMAFAIFTAIGGRGDAHVGYVDHSGLLNPALAGEREDDVVLVPYADEAQARAALESGELQAYYVLSPDYRTDHRASLYYLDEVPGARIESAMAGLVRESLVQHLPPDVQDRLIDGVHLTVRSAAGGREFQAGNPITVALSFVIAFFFYLAVISSGGYMLQAVASEKENRTIEVVATSTGPDTLIGGKAFGLIGVALTQLGLWALTGVIAVVVGAQFMPELRALQVPYDTLGIAILFFLPSFALIAGMMTLLGGAMPELQQAQQLAGMMNLLFVFPMFVLPLFIEQPNSPVIVAMTLFPTTAFLSVVLRWSAAVVPLWQLVASWVLLLTSAVGMFWAAARVFRIGMLRYGQRLSLQGVLAAIGGRVSERSQTAGGTSNA